MTRLFGRAASDKIVRNESDSGTRDLFLGTVCAYRALRLYSHDPTFLDRSPEAKADTEDDSGSADLSRLRWPADPPATRLHPHGPHEEMAQRAILESLSTWLLELGARG